MHPERQEPPRREPDPSSSGVLPAAAELADEARLLGAFTLHVVIALPVLVGAAKLWHAHVGATPLTRLDAADAVALVAWAGAASVSIIARFGVLSRRAAHWLGPIVLIAGTALITAFELLRPVPHGVPMGVSWAVPWIVVYPFMAPVPRRGWWFTLLLCVLCFPAVAALVIVVGPRPPPEGVALLWMWMPYGVAAGLSLLPAQDVLRMRDVTRTGAYHLIDQIGAGGMGEVWRARHQLLARPAAVKLIQNVSNGRVSRDAIARFRREAEAISALRSPHTVQLYDFGVTEQGRLFYVMELLDGLDLGSLVERFGPVPQERAIHLAAQACRSLEEAHPQGLVHRDIKPANLFTCRLGREVDFLKVLDFGLVMATAGVTRGAAHAGLTHAGALAGTPAFLAPEMALGADRATPQSDLYGLGCVLFWLLVGRTVFPGHTVDDQLDAHVQQRPTAPSQLSEGEVSPELDAVVLACLEKRPEERPGSATELRRRLMAIPVTSPWDQARAEAWWNRHLR